MSVAVWFVERAHVYAAIVMLCVGLAAIASARPLLKRAVGAGVALMSPAVLFASARQAGLAIAVTLFAAAAVAMALALSVRLREARDAAEADQIDAFDDDDDRADPDLTVEPT